VRLWKAVRAYLRSLTRRDEPLLADQFRAVWKLLNKDAGVKW
jgi:hypothetical protein